MKDHYTLLHNFLEKHFPAQLPKLEAIKDNDVEVTMMYNMYKKSAKNALKERVVSDNESPSLKAKIAADEFMQYYRKTYRIVSGNFGKEAADEFKKIVKAKFNSISEELEESTINEDLNDPIMVRMRAAQAAKEKKAAKPTINPDYAAVKNAKKIAFLKKEREQLMRDMEQEAEPEGGPIADEYGNKLDKIDATIAKLSGRKEMTYDQAIAENKILKQAKLSSAEYQKAKKLKGFNTEDYEWNPDEGLYVKEKKSKFKKHGEMSGFDMRGINEQMDIYDEIANEEFGMDYDQLGSNEKEWVRDEIDNMSMNEAKATCCHRCGRVHVKGSGCKRPYLKGKDSCAINEIETLKEFYNK